MDYVLNSITPEQAVILAGLATNRKETDSVKQMLMHAQTEDAAFSMRTALSKLEEDRKYLNADFDDKTREELTLREMMEHSSFFRA